MYDPFLYKDNYGCQMGRMNAQEVSFKITSQSLETFTTGMWTVRKQRDRLTIFVDYSHMNSDGENYRMFNEPSGMFLLIQMLLLPVLEQLSL